MNRVRAYRRLTYGRWMTRGLGGMSLLEPLKERLLSYGGTGFQEEGFLSNQFFMNELASLLANGIAFDPAETGVIQCKGRSHECHENILRLVEKEPDKYTMYTGLALSGDGIWRVHSWAVAKDGRIIESTQPRVLYYGAESILEDESIIVKYPKRT